MLKRNSGGFSKLPRRLDAFALPEEPVGMGSEHPHPLRLLLACSQGIVELLESQEQSPHVSLDPTVADMAAEAHPGSTSAYTNADPVTGLESLSGQGSATLGLRVMLLTRSGFPFYRGCRSQCFSRMRSRRVPVLKVGVQGSNR